MASPRFPVPVVALLFACTSGPDATDESTSADTTSTSASTSSASTSTSTTGSADASGSTSVTDSESTGEPPPPVGTVEPFAVVGGANEGLAFADGPDGAPTLFVGLNEAHAVVRVAQGGTVTMHAEVPAPLGMAATRDGGLVVCGLATTATDAPAVIWRVTPTGEPSILVQSDDPVLELTNYVAVASDDTLVFSDSAGNALYRTDADGTALALVTDTITYPNGLAFYDGRLYVASYDSESLYALDYGPGGYGTPELVSDAIATLDGIAVADDGAFYLATTLGGLQRFAMGELTTIADAMEFQVIANGAFAADGYGDGWLYVTNLFGEDVDRVYVGVGGLPLPPT